MDYLQILVDEACVEFHNHLEPDENCRIIFSGQYGSGKTSFIDNFFTLANDKINASKNYEVIKLFPVNYSVGSNEDILSI